MTHRQALLCFFVVCASSAAACARAAQRSLVAAPPAAREAPSPAYQPPAAPAPAAAATGYADVNTDSSLISHGSVVAASDHLLATASAFRREVYRLGGRVFAEQVHFRGGSAGGASGDDDEQEASAATYRIKLLPRLVPDLLDWLGKSATITAQDVSSIVAMESEADASIVRADVQARIAGIDHQLADPRLDPQGRAALDSERTRLTGAAIADPGAVADNTRRVAVLEVRLEPPQRPDPYAHGKLLGHARGSVLGLDVLGHARSHRLGAGFGVGGRSPVSSLEVMGYAASTATERAGVTVTLGFGSYTRAFGAAGRSLRPYVGARLGYAYLQASYFTVGAELGVELVKHRGVLWTVSARPMGLIGGDSQGAIEIGSSLGLAM